MEENKKNILADYLVPVIQDGLDKSVIMSRIEFDQFFDDKNDLMDSLFTPYYYLKNAWVYNQNNEFFKIKFIEEHPEHKDLTIQLSVKDDELLTNEVKKDINELDKIFKEMIPLNNKYYKIIDKLEDDIQKAMDDRELKYPEFHKTLNIFLTKERERMEKKKKRRKTVYHSDNE